MTSSLVALCLLCNSASLATQRTKATRVVECKVCVQLLRIEVMLEGCDNYTNLMTIAKGMVRDRLAGPCCWGVVGRLVARSSALSAVSGEVIDWAAIECYLDEFGAQGGFG